MLRHFPRMPLRPRVAIEQVMKEHHLCADDFFSARRDTYLIKARRAASQRLLALGYTAPQVGKFIGRNHTTVLNYLSSAQEVRGARYAAKRVLRHLNETENTIVVDLAKARGIAPAQLLAEWVSERIAEMTQ